MARSLAERLSRFGSTVVPSESFVGSGANPARPISSLAVALPLTAAIPEEILYRGFLIGRLTRLFGTSAGAPFLAVLAQALVFGSVHFQWGLGGIVVTAIMGAVWGFAYLLCGRNLWIVIIAHSMAHLALVAQLYVAPPP